jgi:hypothetical protein
MAVALDSFGWFLGFYNLMIPALQRYGYGVGQPLTLKLGDGALDERVARSGRVPEFFPRPSVRTREESRIREESSPRQKLKCNPN